MKKLDTSFTGKRFADFAAAAAFLVVVSWSQAVLAQNVRRPWHRVMPRIPEVSTPEEQGMDSTTLAAGIDFLLENRETYRVHSVVVIRNDSVVLDARFYPFSSEWRHDIASVTKSFTSTLVGIAIDKGFIAGVDVPVLDFFPDSTIANRDDRKERMTLEIAMPELAGGPLITLQIGLDNVDRFSPGRSGVMTASKGGWVSDNHFSATMDELGLINLWQWDLTFEGDTVALTLESLAGGELPATATGTVVP